MGFDQVVRGQIVQLRVRLCDLEVLGADYGFGVRLIGCWIGLLCLESH